MLKKLTIGLVFLGILIVSIYAATAAPVLSVTSLSLTGRPGEIVQDIVYVTTNSTVAVNNVVISFSGLGPEYQLNASPSTFNLAAGGSQQVTIYGMVPKRIDTTKTFTGKVVATAGTLFNSNNVVFVPKGQLTFSSVSVKYGTKSKGVSTDSSSYVEVRPGDSIRITGKVYNRFGSMDVRIENVDVTATGDGSDFTVDETDSISDIDSRSSSGRTFDISFDIPDDQDEDTIPITLEATGFDEFGSFHKDEINFDIRIRKVNDDISITSYSINPSLVSCSRSIELSMNIQNVGADDQRQAAITIENTQLGIKDKEDLITLDADVDSDENTYQKSFTHTLDKNVEAGSYEFKFVAYYDDDKVLDTKLATLTVQDCGAKVTTTVPPLTTTPTTVVFNTGQQPVNFQQPNKGSILDNNTYLAVLIGAIVVVAVLGFAMIVYLFKPK
jgi:hypothetical protein